VMLRYNLTVDYTVRDSFVSVEGSELIL
jgi:hypothetical protein